MTKPKTKTPVELQLQAVKEKQKRAKTTNAALRKRITAISRELKQKTTRLADLEAYYAAASGYIRQLETGGADRVDRPPYAAALAILTRKEKPREWPSRKPPYISGRPTVKLYKTS